MKKKISILFFLPLFVFAHQNKIDSLLSLIKNDKQDTNKINHLNILSRAMINSSYDSSIAFSNAALKLSEQISPPYKRGISIAYNNLGIVNSLKGNSPKALDYFLKAFKIDEELNDKNGMAKRLGNIGIEYKKQGNFPKALEYYLKALKIDEQLVDKKGIARHLNNIADLYYVQEDYSKSLDYKLRALKIAQDIGDQEQLMGILGGIGNIYDEQAKLSLINKAQKYVSDSLYKIALHYDFMALSIAEKQEDKDAIARHLGNIGNIYKEQANTMTEKNDTLSKKALENYFKAIKLKKELGDTNGIAIWLGNIGELYMNEKKYLEAEKYLLNALKIYNKISSPEEERQFEELLSQLYSTTNRYELALNHYKRAMVLKDTLFNIEKNKDLTRKEMNYEFEKKEALTKAEQEKKDAVVTVEKRRKNLFLIFIGAIALAVAIIAGIIFRSLRITKRQKQIIEVKSKETEEQKRLVEERQKEILDSIRYAKRIQDAILPRESYIDKTLKRLMKKN